MMDKPDCELCRKIKETRKRKPDCKKCLPYLYPENQIPFAIFWRIKNQHIMGDVLPIDLKMDVARNEIARFIENMDDQDYCFDLIYTAYDAYRQKIKERYDEKIYK